MKSALIEPATASWELRNDVILTGSGRVLIPLNLRFNTKTKCTARFGNVFETCNVGWEVCFLLCLCPSKTRMVTLIPKKGNLSNCDNWRGIALLNVVGNAAASILQERLHAAAGWRGTACVLVWISYGPQLLGHGFTVCQLVKKAFEHQTKQFLTFINL